MPPPGYEPFLAAVCAAPDDDLPRLVYADWLDEQGDHERAEFIRLHVERGRVREQDSNSTLHAERIHELLNKNEHAWRAELRRIPGVNWQRFWRGFVSGADVSPGSRLLDIPSTLFGTTPVQFLTLRRLDVERLRSVLALPQLRKLAGLTIHDALFGDDGFQAIGSSPNVCNLTTLTVRPADPAPRRVVNRHYDAFGPELTIFGVARLNISVYLRKLRAVDLRGYRMDRHVTEYLRERFPPPGSPSR